MHCHHYSEKQTSHRRRPEPSRRRAQRNNRISILACPERRSKGCSILVIARPKAAAISIRCTINAVFFLLPLDFLLFVLPAKRCLFFFTVFAKTSIITLAPHQTCPECNRRIGKLASFGAWNRTAVVRLTICMRDY